LIAPRSLYGQHHAQDIPEYARAYAELGLGVVPVHGMVAEVCTCGEGCGRNAGKHPIAQLVRRGVKDASTCPETVSEWYCEWPAANVAIACGSVSEIVVVDSDGEVGVAELERRGYPVTWTARSGSGWLHVYLEHPGHRVGNWKIPGIGELRADGGYIVAPPSRHRSGGRYEWLEGLSPWDVGLEGCRI
jgi:putative DNA primase/helicase